LLVSIATVGLFTAVGVVGAPEARAQSPAELAKARESYRQGLSLEASHDWTRALATFKAVALVKSNAQVRYHIGVCEEKLGDLVQALGSYRLAESEVVQNDPKSKEVAAALRDAIASIEPRIPKLTVKRGRGAEVAELRRDGELVKSATVGSPLAINPGPHVLTGTAEDRDPVRIEITIAESESKTVEVTMNSKPTAAPAEASPVRAESLEPAPSSSGSGMKAAGIVGVVLGAASLGVAGAFFAMRQSAVSELDGVCGADRQSCPASAADTRDRGQLDATVATATFIGGVSALVVGGILILAAPRAKREAKPASAVLVTASPRATAGGGFVVRF
jgi:hypothetical protein